MDSLELLPPIQVNEVQDEKTNISIQLGNDVVERFQIFEPYLRSITNHMHDMKLTSNLGVTKNSQGSLCKTAKDHDKMFDANLIPK